MLVLLNFWRFVYYENKLMDVPNECNTYTVHVVSSRKPGNVLLSPYSLNKLDIKWELKIIYCPAIPVDRINTQVIYRF